MTTLSFAAVDDTTADLLSLVADEWTPLALDDAHRFHAACRAEAMGHDGWVNPNSVRARLMVGGELQIDPRRYSALWSVACGKSGYLDVHRDVLVPISGAGSKHNGGKRLPMRRWRGWSTSP